jgi:hypothetical protein
MLKEKKRERQERDEAKQKGGECPAPLYILENFRPRQVSTAVA